MDMLHMFLSCRIANFAAVSVVGCLNFMRFWIIDS